MQKSAVKPARTKAKVVLTNATARDLALTAKTIPGDVKDAGSSITDFCRFPDIVGSWQWISRVDDTVKASLICENIGTRSTYENDSGFRVQVYLSNDDVLDAGDTHVKEIWVTSLLPGESSPPKEVLYKSVEPLTGKFLIAALDRSSATDGSSVFESDETNNLVKGVIP